MSMFCREMVNAGCGGRWVLGAVVAEWIRSQYLPKVFGVIVLCLSVQMYRSIRALQNHPMPSAWITTLCGTGIGVISSLSGIGGGSLSVPFESTWH